jgi:hypothetical protein
MKTLNKLLGYIESSLNGSLDEIQFDNTADVIEKSLVIEIVEDLKILLSEAQLEVKNISSNHILEDSKNLNEWVDVRDKLPNHTNEVLIIDVNYDDYYGIGAYRKNDGWALQGTNFWKPTHWKELDKPSTGLRNK